MLFEDKLFDDWLDSEAKKAIDKFRNNEQLTIEDKMMLTLKAQTNHFIHLDVELREDIKNLDLKFSKEIERLDEKIEKYQEENIKRFEQIDRRFEQIDKRFEQIDRRFEQIDKRFEQIDKRFEQIDEKFEKIDEKFEKIHKDMNRLYSAINSQTWKMIGAIGLIVVFIKVADNLPQLIEFFRG